MLTIKAVPLISAYTAAKEMHVTPSTIRTWARRYPHLLPRRGRDWDQDGATLYDVADLAHIKRLIATGSRLQDAETVLQHQGQ